MFCKRIKIILFFCVTTFIFTGCMGNQTIDNSGKSDADLIADMHVKKVYEHLFDLSVKLYKRNPRELKKAKIFNVKDANARITTLFEFKENPDYEFEEFTGKKGVDVLNLALDPSYQGDRVFCMMAGLIGMVRASYNNKTKIYMWNDLDPQKLYNSARNIEILAWKLKTVKDSKNNLLILTNSLPGEELNLSYERLFGKMISIQDMMSQVASGATDRSINKVVHFFVSKILFLPVGL